MLLIQAEQIAEVSGGNADIAIWFGGAIGALILVDRVLHILQSRGLLRTNGKKRSNNPHGLLSFITPDEWSKRGDQLDELWKWHKPDRPNASVPGQKIWWMPWDEFETLMDRVTESNERSTQATNMLVVTLEAIQAAGRLRDQELEEHRRLLEKILRSA